MPAEVRKFISTCEPTLTILVAIDVLAPKAPAAGAVVNSQAVSRKHRGHRPHVQWPQDRSQYLNQDKQAESGAGAGSLGVEWPIHQHGGIPGNGDGIF